MDPAQRYILCEALRLGSPDQAASDPVLGSGGARNIQLGLKILFLGLRSCHDQAV